MNQNGHWKFGIANNKLIENTMSVDYLDLSRISTTKNIAKYGTLLIKQKKCTVNLLMINLMLKDRFMSDMLSSNSCVN